MSGGLRPRMGDWEAARRTRQRTRDPCNTCRAEWKPGSHGQPVRYYTPRQRQKCNLAPAFKVGHLAQRQWWSPRIRVRGLALPLRPPWAADTECKPLSAPLPFIGFSMPPFPSALSSTGPLCSSLSHLGSGGDEADCRGAVQGADAELVSHAEFA